MLKNIYNLKQVKAIINFLSSNKMLKNIYNLKQSTKPTNESNSDFFPLNFKRPSIKPKLLPKLNSNQAFLIQLKHFVSKESAHKGKETITDTEKITNTENELVYNIYRSEAFK